MREYVEDRAFIRAVISLPQETFYSAGASVKASLLFLHKFTDKEKAGFDKKKEAARVEVEAKYRNEISTRVSAFEADIEAAEKDKKRRAELMKALKEYRREMDTKIIRGSRALLKARFSYPIFLYEAEKVGITATGEADQNELYPNPDVPPGVERTVLELYREFRKGQKKQSMALAAE